MDAEVSADPEELDQELLDQELFDEEEPAPHEAASERELYVGVEPPEYTEPEDAPPRHEERLQKIIAHAGIASRRHAEELIAEGHVQVNGQTITAPGHKADPNRDHIRVDGKLLQGSERLRYFVLNKPRGYVTTVSDPEGRPTIMEFFKRQGERLYPVGRLDYQSEGLLLVTNDGPLANQLTRAASGVEKTYLVKISGTPSEEALEKLRTGVAIAKGKPSEGRVRTSPTRIRVVRAGENPWYEVVLVEGRNRELRKMFEEIGHRVEKIRRVAYGPLVLDVPAGTTRELVTEEVDMLRRAAAGKFKSRKIDFSVLLPKEAGRSVDHEAAKERELRGVGKRPYGKNFRFEGRGQSRDQDSGQSRGPARGYDRPQGAKPAFGRSGFSKPGFSKPGFDKPGFGKPAFSKDGPDTRRSEGSEERPARSGPGRDFGGQGGRRFDSRPPQRSFEVRPASGSGEVDAPREGFGRGHEGSQDRRQDRYQDRGDNRGQERGSEQRGFGERSSSGQRGGQSFRPSGERGSFGRGREGGGKTFGSRPEGRSGFKPGFKSGDRPAGRPAFKSGPRTGFGAGSGPDSGTGTRPGGSRGGFGERREGGGPKRFGSRPEGRPAGRSGFKSDSRPGDRPTGRPAYKSSPRTGFGAGSGSDSGPRPRPSGFQSGTRSEGRPAGRPGFKSGFQSGDRPSGKPAFKSSSRPVSGPKPGGSRGGFKSGSKSGPRPGGKPGFKSGGPGRSGPGRSGGPRRDSNRGRGKDI
jgi:23S rRNA pseudouridine2605 synthase